MSDFFSDFFMLLIALVPVGILVFFNRIRKLIPMSSGKVTRMRGGISTARDQVKTEITVHVIETVSAPCLIGIDVSQSMYGLSDGGLIKFSVAEAKVIARMLKEAADYSPGGGGP